MRQFLLACICLLAATVVKAQGLSYYLPADVRYNPAIPEPASVIRHEVGEWHITHDRLVSYMTTLAAAAPGRIKMEKMGYTYESRPQVLLIITSPSNHQRLESIRQQHLLLGDPGRSSGLTTGAMPVVVYIGHSIHGNESSGANAALLSAYYLAAAEGPGIDSLLNNVVILFDPSFNPDGLQRFSTWANQHKSKNLVTDPNSREFNEVWPGGRFNHYWFDLNRDWLPAVHIESQNRLQWFHAWKPNILTDHHEMGSNATFFFQPGVSSRVNPLTPAKNQALTEKIGRFHAKYLDRIGSLYYSKENYDDFYYGKGSTYPDVNGGIGILFEQASSRGHAQETVNGILRFPATIKNQFTTTLSTLEAAQSMRKELLDYQRDFYQQTDPTLASRGYVFGDPQDPAKTFHFIEMLQRHQIVVNELADGYTDGGFKKGSAYAVSLNQPQQLLIRTIFEKQLQFKDSLFYDITSWTMPLAFGLSCAEVTAANVYGKKLDPVRFPAGSVAGGVAAYAYLLPWSDFYTPRALYALQSAGVLVKVATRPFTITIGDGSSRRFDYGTLMVPVSLQGMRPDSLYSLMSRLAVKNGLTICAAGSGDAASGSDLGSTQFAGLAQPSIALLVGQGVNATDAGEIWHLLDQRMDIPSSHLEVAVFNRVELTRYNTIIMAGGSYTELNKDKLRAWVQAGGNLILIEEAVTWASQNGLGTVNLKRAKPAVDSTMRLTYTDREQVEGAQQMNGAIFGAEADLTHPLAYGYHQPMVSFFKANKVFMEKSRNPFATPFYYGNAPLQSGWVSRQNGEAVKNSAAVVVNTLGNGRIINIADNPVFRAFWLGSSKLLLNAIFFGKVIDAASGRGE